MCIMIVLKPQDIVVLLKTITLGETKWTYESLAAELYMTPSAVHNSIKRAALAQLWNSAKKKPFKRVLEEFIIHGVKYAFPPNSGGIAIGLPTASAGPPLNKLLLQTDLYPFVWPDPKGTVRGVELLPLHKNVPMAAAIDPKLYEYLVLVDAIRTGKAREKGLAIAELKERFSKT